MSEVLKPGWRRVKFGQVVRLNKESSKDPAADGLERYVGLEHLEPGDLRIRSWGDIADGTTFTNRFRPGQVLFGKRRAYQRKVAVADFDGVCSGDIYVLEPTDPGMLLPELLPFISQTDAFFDHAAGTSAGSLSPRTNWKSLAEYRVALPPVKEQRRYVDMLIQALEAYESVIDYAASYGRLLQSFCSDIKGRNDWEFSKIGQIAKFTSGKSMRVTSLPQERTPSHPFPVYGGNGISGWSDKFLDGLPNSFPVLGRVGQYCGVAHLAPSPSWITDNALYPKSMSSAVLPEYLLICLKGARLNINKLGEYWPLITQKVVHETLIPLPDIEKQRELVSAFEQIGSADRLINDRRRATAQVLQDLSSQFTDA